MLGKQGDTQKTLKHIKKHGKQRDLTHSKSLLKQQEHGVFSKLARDEDPRFSLSARPCFACAPARVFLKSCGKSAQGLNANFGVKSWMIQLRLANVDWSVGLKSKCQTEHLQPNRKIMGILWDINSQMLNNLWANDLDQEEPLISSFFQFQRGRIVGIVLPLKLGYIMIYPV